MNSAPPTRVSTTAWNRAAHRVGGMLAALLFLWIAGTGVLIQVLDLRAVLSHRALPDPTALSMAEGMYGPPDFAVAQAGDLQAEPLPRGLDLEQAFAVAVRAAGDSRWMAWAEIRIAHGVPVVQVMDGTLLRAFRATDGAPMLATAPTPIPQGGRLPASLRQKLKTWHRFWDRHDVPGVYVEFAAGLALWLLLITGLVLYIGMLRTRTRHGRTKLLWVAGGWWRTSHRIVSALAAVFLVCIAASGTWLGFESSVHTFLQSQPLPAVGLARSLGLRHTPGDVVVPLHSDQVPRMAAVAADAMRRLHPGVPVTAMRLRIFGTMKQGVVVTGGNRLQQFVFDADTGQPASLTEPGYPASGFPFGTAVHEWVKHFHSGELFGITGQVMNLLAGASLLFLAVSGIVLYVDVWRKRRRAGLHGVAWR